MSSKCTKFLGYKGLQSESCVRIFEPESESESWNELGSCRTFKPVQSSEAVKISIENWKATSSMFHFYQILGRSRCRIGEGGTYERVGFYEGRRLDGNVQIQIKFRLLVGYRTLVGLLRQIKDGFFIRAHRLLV
ncbi:hypothetical protein LXL04_016274 [Taraxacum kok-saghyz]